MGRLRNRLRWRRRVERVRGTACARLTPPAGLCDPCRELLAKQPAVVVKAEGYPVKSGLVVPPHG
jgi:hypothetical protein